MSLEYDAYLQRHINTVRFGYNWILQHIPTEQLNDILPDIKGDTLQALIENHDRSKYTESEYSAYDRYFYKDGKNTDDGKREFEYAWLHHLHNNPHHWQYWVLKNDEDEPQFKALDMPDVYIFEMICDWWSFSWKDYIASPYTEHIKRKQLYEIFDWYDEHKPKMILSEETRVKVEALLYAIKTALNAQQLELGL